MKRAGLIGLGTITAKYIKGLKHPTFFSLCAVSDLNPNAVSRELFRDYPFFEDYRTMIREAQLDLVIISSPPESHFDLAMYCLEHGVDVVIEKPVVLCMEQFDLLCKTARDKGLLLRTLFHWLGGVELRRFAQEYDIAQIKEINIRVLDPYSEDEETIVSDRRPLMGSWIDSGVNALSMVKQWLPFAQVSILRCESRKCKQTGMPLVADVSLLIDGVKVNFLIDWTQHQNVKETFVTLNDRTVHIHHSSQSIIDGENRICCQKMERMEQHYNTLFSEMEYISNDAYSAAVHRVLLEVAQAL